MTSQRDSGSSNRDKQQKDNARKSAQPGQQPNERRAAPGNAPEQQGKSTRRP